MMEGVSPFLDTWQFARDRLAQSVEGLTEAQVAWRPHEGGHSIAEMLLHMAGAEHWFGHRLLGLDPRPDAEAARIDMAVRSNFLNAEPFPFRPEEATLPAGLAALERTAALVRPILADPSPEVLSARVESPLGPVIDGVGGLWRLVTHPPYHTGQIWLYRADHRFLVA
jgi:hypothetical protein